MAKHAHSIDRAVLQRIRARKGKRAFSAADFLDLGSPAAVYQALSRNARAGTIRKVARGVYDHPRFDREFGLTGPSLDAVVGAMQSRSAIRIQPSGAHAANLLGLSDQVPVQAVFLTDGPPRTLHVGKRRVTLKRTTPRQMATAGRISGTLIQALRWMGRRNVDDVVIEKLRRRLSKREKRQLLADLQHAPAWIADVMRAVAQVEPTRRGRR